MTDLTHQASVARFNAAVVKERERQVEKWGVQTALWADTPNGETPYADNATMYKRLNDERQAADKPGYWDAILLEEVYEALEEIEKGDFKAALKELDEVATVAAAMAHQIEREHPELVEEEEKPKPKCRQTYSMTSTHRGVKITTGIGICLRDLKHEGVHGPE